jgi:hypothetical protein
MIPKNGIPVFGKRSCSTNKIERDDDSKKSHLALSADAGIRGLAVPSTYDVHPEFGYFCLAPRMRRELRVGFVSILAGMAIGAAIVTVGAGHASDAVSRDAHLGSSGSDAVPLGDAGPSPELKAADNAKANPVEGIEPYPMRMARVRSSKAPSPLAGIPLGRTAPAEATASAAPTAPENAEASVPRAAPPSAQLVATTAEPAVSNIKKRPSAVHARRHWEGEDENVRWQSRRWPSWGERAYAEDRYWRGGYRNWVY